MIRIKNIIQKIGIKKKQKLEKQIVYLMLLLY